MKKSIGLTVALLLLFVIVSGWTAWWFFLATYAQRIAETAAESGGAPQFAYGGSERYGFPFTVGVRFADVAAATHWGDGDATVNAGVVTVEARPWRPQTLVIGVPDGLSYRVEGPPGAPPLVEGVAASGVGTATTSPEPRIEMTLADIVSRPQGAAPVRATTGRVVWTAIGPDKQAVDVALGEIALAENALFGPEARRAAASLVLTGPLPQRGDAAEIAAWRAAGGKVDIRSAEIDWGALQVTGDGAVGLDDAYRLAGGVDLSVRNAVAAVSRLEEVGLLTREGAAAARTVAALASLTGGGAAKAPLVFADGEASVAGFTIARLLPVCACR